MRAVAIADFELQINNPNLPYKKSIIRLESSVNKGDTSKQIAANR